MAGVITQGRIEPVEHSRGDVRVHHGLPLGHDVAKGGGRVRRERPRVLDDASAQAGLGVGRGEGLERALLADPEGHHEVCEPRNDLADDSARNLTAVERRKKDEARDAVEKCRTASGRLGERVGAGHERGRHDLTRTHREVFLCRAPAPAGADVLVAEHTGESALHPDRDVEHRRDLAQGRVVSQLVRARIGGDVLDAQFGCVSDCGEVSPLVGLEQRGAVLEAPRARDVSGVAADARSLVAEAPEARRARRGASRRRTGRSGGSTRSSRRGWWTPVRAAPGSCDARTSRAGRSPPGRAPALRCRGRCQCLSSRRACIHSKEAGSAPDSRSSAENGAPQSRRRYASSAARSSGESCEVCPIAPSEPESSAESVA